MPLSWKVIWSRLAAGSHTKVCCWAAKCGSIYAWHSAAVGRQSSRDICNRQRCLSFHVDAVGLLCSGRGQVERISCHVQGSKNEQKWSQSGRCFWADGWMSSNDFQPSCRPFRCHHSSENSSAQSSGTLVLVSRLHHVHP